MRVSLCVCARVCLRLRGGLCVFARVCAFARRALCVHLTYNISDKSLISIITSKEQ